MTTVFNEILENNAIDELYRLISKLNLTEREHLMFKNMGSSCPATTESKMDKCRVLFAQGYTNNEVAELTGLSVVTVRTYRFRASIPKENNGRKADPNSNLQICWRLMGEGKSNCEIQAITGFKREMVSSYRSRFLKGA